MEKLCFNIVLFLGLALPLPLSLSLNMFMDSARTRGRRKERKFRYAVLHIGRIRRSHEKGETCYAWPKRRGNVIAQLNSLKTRASERNTLEKLSFASFCFLWLPRRSSKKKGSRIKRRTVDEITLVPRSARSLFFFI